MGQYLRRTPTTNFTLLSDFDGATSSLTSYSVAMEPTNVGRNIFVSTGSYGVNRYFHIRKYYKGHPSTYGVAFTTDELTALRNAVKYISKMHKKGKGFMEVCESISVKTSSKWVTFTKGERQISLLKEEWGKVKTHLSSAHTWMLSPVINEPTKSYKPPNRSWKKTEAERVDSSSDDSDEEEKEDTQPKCPHCLDNPKSSGGVCQNCGYISLTTWTNGLYKDTVVD